MKIMSGNSNLPLARAIAAYLEIPLTDASVRRFADEEVFVGDPDGDGSSVRSERDERFADGCGTRFHPVIVGGVELAQLEEDRKVLEQHGLGLIRGV